MKQELLTASHTVDDSELESVIRREQIALFRKQSFTTNIANAAAAVCLYIALLGVFPLSILSAWLVTILGFNFARHMMAVKGSIDNVSSEELRARESQYLTMVLISGLLWGSASVLFFAAGQLEYILFLVLVIVSMVAGATATLSYHSSAYLLFVIPAVLPLEVQLLLHREHMMLSILVFIIPIYFSIALLLSRQIYAISRKSIVNQVEHQRLAHVDYLTGLANRRAFEEHLNDEWRRGTRTREALSLIIADIDNFKSFNDAHGHPAGDEILVAVARIIQLHFKRTADLTARVGGEEFAVLLPNTSNEQACYLAEQLRQQMTTKARNEMKERYGDITMSFGVSTCIPDSAENVDKLYGYADKALYRSKSEGKDKVSTLFSSTCADLS